MSDPAGTGGSVARRESSPRLWTAAAAAAARIREQPATVVLALLALLAGVVIFDSARGSTFYYDDWDFVLGRREWNLDTFLEPHNEHFSLVPVALYKLLFATVGLEHYGAYRVAILLVHVTIVALLFALTRKRIGDWPALALCVPLLFLGAGWLDILWPFQLGFLISIAAALTVIMALDRGDRRGDVLACALLVVALCSSSLGVPIAIAVAASVLLREDRRKRAWIFAVPLSAYALWYLGYGKSAARASNLNDVPGYVAEAAGGALSAVSGLGIEFGRVLAVLLAILVVRELVDSRRFSPRLVTLSVLPVAFWALTALARAQFHEPTSPRYLYPGAVFVLLVLAYFLERARLRPTALVLLFIAAAASAVSNTQGFTNGGNHLQAAAGEIRANLAAVELAASSVDPDMVVNPGQPQIKAGPYLEAVRDIGSSPAYMEEELLRMRSSVREAADQVLLRVYGQLVGPAQPGAAKGPRPRVASLHNGELSASASCVGVTPQSGSPVADLGVPAGGLEIGSLQRSTEVELRLRRFGDAFPKDRLDAIAGGSATALRIPGDSSRRPWHAELRSEGPFRVCALRPG